MTNKTEREIKLAIARIRHGKQKRIAKDRKFSIAAVAEEAGISNATIHNRYPDLADHIRSLLNEDAKATRTTKRIETEDHRRLIKELRNSLKERDIELKKIAIENLKLSQEIKLLKSQKTIRRFPTEQS